MYETYVFSFYFLWCNKILTFYVLENAIENWKYNLDQFIGYKTLETK